LPLIDLKMLLGSGRTSQRRVSRVISINHREIPAGIVVDEVQGFRRFVDSEYVEHAPQTAARCERFLHGAYERGPDTWPVFDFYELLESSTFLQAAAD
jgi:twitching motility protein PilI